MKFLILAEAQQLIDIGVNFHPTDNDEFQITYSFTNDEGLSY